MLHNGPCAYAYFSSVLSTIKMKLGHILMCYMTNISNILWISSRPFYDFDKVTIKRDLAVFNSWHLTSLIVPYTGIVPDTGILT